MSQDPPRVLVVEDDPRIGPRVVAGLVREGFDAVLAPNGQSADALLAGSDLVVLDLMLPDLDGFELLERWRYRACPPIVVLTADTRLPARLRSFEMGAVDWIPKPFFMEELVARLRARLGGGAVQAPPQLVTLGEAVLDLGRRQVLLGEAPLSLTSHEVNLLAVLACNPGRAFTRAQLAERALPSEGARLDRTVDSHVSHLRRKLGPDAARLETIYGVGYAWIVP